MNNQVEIDQSMVALAADSVNVQPQPAVAAIVKTHHEQKDTDQLVRDIQEAGVSEAQPAGASVAPLTEPSPAILKTIEAKIEEAGKSKLPISKPRRWKIITDLMRLGRQKLGQLKAA